MEDYYKRAEMIAKLERIGMELVKDYNWDTYCKMWDMCSDWNRDHEESLEIFMSEVSDDDDNVDGFMIEDRIFRFEN